MIRFKWIYAWNFSWKPTFEPSFSLPRIHGFLTHYKYVILESGWWVLRLPAYLKRRVDHSQLVRQHPNLESSHRSNPSIKQVVKESARIQFEDLPEWNQMHRAWTASVGTDPQKEKTVIRLMAEVGNRFNTSTKKCTQ
jgi:hypothetical protein